MPQEFETNTCTVHSLPHLVLYVRTVPCKAINDFYARNIKFPHESPIVTSSKVN